MSPSIPSSAFGLPSHGGATLLFAITALVVLRAAHGKRLFFSESDYQEFLRDPSQKNQSHIVKSDTTPPDFANPRFTDDGDIDANWTERNHEARRGAKFQLTIVDFARGPTLTKVTWLLKPT